MYSVLLKTLVGFLEITPYKTKTSKETEQRFLTEIMFFIL